MDHSNMDMGSSGDVPEGLKVAENPLMTLEVKRLLNQIIWKALRVRK